MDVHFSLQQQFASLAIVSPSNLKWKPRKQLQTIIISLLTLLLDQSLKNIRLIQFRTADIYQEREEATAKQLKFASPSNLHYSLFAHSQNLSVAEKGNFNYLHLTDVIRKVK